MIKKPRGTKDVLPNESYKWHFIEDICKDVCKRFNYKEVRFPTFEVTELFARGVGDTTDVVQKEMYTFTSKGESSLTLRPEGTSSTVRMFLENGLYGGALPAKYFYIIPCFRYEKPQAGRLREFHQFGVEVFGAYLPQTDAEVIALANDLFKNLGIKDLTLSLNSIGCPTCRTDYNKKLKEYFEPRLSELCETCRGRFEKNPMRIIDCKSPVCNEIAKDAPRIIDHICDECSDHFTKVKDFLTEMGIDYTIDPNIVRGLDYYTKTVFEFVSNSIGAQGTVCGGGRYDGLIEQLGGKPMAGIGFAMGIERLMMLMENEGLSLGADSVPTVFLAYIGDDNLKTAMRLTNELRAVGVSAECDLVAKSLKAQMKYADKIGAEFVCVIGDDEIKQNRATLKNMRSGETFEVALNDIAKGEKLWLK